MGGIIIAAVVAVVSTAGWSVVVHRWVLLGALCKVKFYRET